MVDDNTIIVDNNKSFQVTLAEVVLPDSNKPSQPTSTVRCGESDMDGETVGKDTAGEVFEEKRRFK